MDDRGGRPRRKRAWGPVVRSRARRRTGEAVVVAVVGTVLAAGLGIGAAYANAALPGINPSANTAFIEPDGTVVVTVQGTWNWPFSGLPHTEGLNATLGTPCDKRIGVGWGITWNDPNDPGIVVSYGARGQAVTVGLGSIGTNPANTDQSVRSNGPPMRCGTFTQTNIPGFGDGFVSGTWIGKHTYASVHALPSLLCVVTFDLGFGPTPAPKYTKFDTNDDNSIVWQLKLNQGGWSQSPAGPNCMPMPTPVLAPSPPPTTPTPTLAPVITPSSPSGPATPAALRSTVPATAPARPASSGTLAFTGFGRVGQLMCLVGFVLVLLGLLLYFVDVRRTVQWLLGL